MAASWEDLELNDLALKELRITPPPPPPSGPPPASTSQPDQRGAAAALASEYPNVDEGLLEQLRDPRERLQVLRMEVEVERFIQDESRDRLEFPPHLTPFQRMLAHRVAQHYQLQTTVEALDTGEPQGRVVARKTHRSSPFRVMRLADIPSQEQSASTSDAGSGGAGVRLMRRVNSQDGLAAGAEQRSGVFADEDSLERAVKLKEEEYNRARQRIFSSGNLASSGSESSITAEPDPLSVTPAEPSYSNSSLNFVPTAVQVSGSSSPTTDRTPSPQSAPSATGPAKGNSRSRPGTGKSRPSKPGETVEDVSTSQGRGRGKGRQKAVFRDKDKDSQDPDFQRGRSRFEQRFDPSAFGMPTHQLQQGHGVYAMPTYASEFPSLGGCPTYSSDFPSLGVATSSQGMMSHPPPPMRDQQPQATSTHHHHQLVNPGGIMGQQGLAGMVGPWGSGQQQPGGGMQQPYGQHLPYGAVHMPPYGMQHPRPQAGMYHPQHHHPPPPLPFGGIPMPPGHYGFMLPSMHQGGNSGNGPYQPGYLPQQQQHGGAYDSLPVVTPPPARPDAGHQPR